MATTGIIIKYLHPDGGCLMMDASWLRARTLQELSDDYNAATAHFTPDVADKVRIEIKSRLQTNG